jgi:hypothetical protein
MRKPRDLDQELQSLIARTKGLQDRKLKQLGELVIATGADALDAETLAGGLLALVESASPERKESWRSRGRGFFRRGARRTAGADDRHGEGAEERSGAAASAGREPGAT